MNKLSLLIAMFTISGVIEPINPVVYFSDVEMIPMNKENDLIIKFEYTAPEKYSSIFTTFKCKINKLEVAQFKRYPGYGFIGEFIISEEKIFTSLLNIELIADCNAYTVITPFILYQESYNQYDINMFLDGDKEIKVENSVVKIEKYGVVNYIDEKYSLLFEKEVISNNCYKIDLKSIQFQYDLLNYDFKYESAELLLYGTKDDFPRLVFSEEKAGYVFNVKVLKNNNYYLQIDEQFYIDEKTLMISKSSGDYFDKCNDLYISKSLRNRQSKFPFRITLNKCGVHKITLIYEGVYIFNKDPIGYSSTSLISITEENLDEKIGDDYQIW